jgi:hypothetical protein
MPRHLAEGFKGNTVAGMLHLEAVVVGLGGGAPGEVGFGFLGLGLEGEEGDGEWGADADFANNASRSHRI